MIVDIPQNISLRYCSTRRPVMPMQFWGPYILLLFPEVHVDEETGMKRYPFELQAVPRLHWEDPTADHLMTHEVSNQLLLAFVGLQMDSLGIQTQPCVHYPRALFREKRSICSPLVGSQPPPLLESQPPPFP